MALEFRIVFTAFLTLGVLSTIYQIGRPRKPIEHSTAVVTTIINVGLIAGLWWLL